MDYQDTLTYLYNSTPMFQQVGGSAYKEGLENTLALDEHFGHPHRKFRTIHVAGTNGKGSCSHTIAAILQEAGYSVGAIYLAPFGGFSRTYPRQWTTHTGRVCHPFCGREALLF